MRTYYAVPFTDELKVPNGPFSAYLEKESPAYKTLCDQKRQISIVLKDNDDPIPVTVLNSLGPPVTAINRIVQDLRKDGALLDIDICKPLDILDICAVPEHGWMQAIRSQIPGFDRVYGIALPAFKPSFRRLDSREQRHHRQRLVATANSSSEGTKFLATRVPATYAARVEYADITQLAEEFGYLAASFIELTTPHDPDHHHHDDHQDKGGKDEPSSCELRPLDSKPFDVVIADTSPYTHHAATLNPLGTHARTRAIREREALLHALSTLILALQRVGHGGSLILHLPAGLGDVRSAEALVLLRAAAAAVRVYKPPHAAPWSAGLYALVLDVNPYCPAARHALRMWKQDWGALVVQLARDEVADSDSDSDGDGGGDEDEEEENEDNDRFERAFARELGPEVVGAGEQAWKMQALALKAVLSSGLS